MIICCGEALIDMLPVRTGEGAAAYQPTPGGAVFNTAIALGRLGASAHMITGLSEDCFGDLLTRCLSDSGVDTALSVRSARPTTLAFVDLVDGQASYRFYDENSAARMLVGDDLPPPPPAARALFFGGISLIGEPCGAAYEALFTAAIQDRVTMVDVNVRPGLIRHEAAYRARIERMTRRADIVKLSDEDALWLYGAGQEQAAIRRLLAAGVKLVVISRGQRGVRAYTPGRMLEAPAPEASVIDTVGAGDTFNAGLLAGLDGGDRLHKAALSALTGAQLRDALMLGVSAAAVTVSRAGADPPWREELTGF